MASPHREIFSVFFVFVFVVSVRPPPGLPPGFGALPASFRALPAGSEALPAEKISLCGDAIGHRPLRGRCPNSGKVNALLQKHV